MKVSRTENFVYSLMSLISCDASTWFWITVSLVLSRDKLSTLSLAFSFRVGYLSSDLELCGLYHASPEVIQHSAQWVICYIYKR